MSAFHGGYNRAMKLAGFDIQITPGDPYEMGVAARHEKEDYFLPSVFHGTLPAAAAGGLAGGKYQAMTGQRFADTLRDVRTQGPEATLQKIQQGHRQIFDPAIRAAREDMQARLLEGDTRLLPAAEKFLGTFEKEKYLRRMGRGALMAAPVALAGKALLNASLYGTGYGLASDPPLSAPLSERLMGLRWSEDVGG